MQDRPENEERWQDEGKPAEGLRIWRKLVIAAVIFGALCIFAIIWTVLSQFNLSWSNHTKDMTTVDIKLDGWKPLRIPKAYLADSRNRWGGDQETVSIEVVYPSMRPKTLVPGYKREDLVYITFMSADRNFSKMTYFEKMKKMRPYLVPTEFGIGKISDSYYTDEKLGKAPSMTVSDSNDSYMAILPGRFIQVECPKKSESLCKVFTNFDENITGYILFYPRLMPEHWTELDKKIIMLTDSFIKFTDSE